MVAIKSLAHLSLSRSSSSPATHRASNDSAQPVSEHNLALNPMQRPARNEDYYLSDDQLILSKPSGHLKALQSVHLSSDGKFPHIKQTSANFPSTQATSNTVVQNASAAKVSASNQSTLAVSTKAQALASSTPATPSVYGQPQNPLQPTGHKHLMSSLRSVSTKHTPLATLNATPHCSTPNTPPSFYPADQSPSPVNTIALHNLEASYVSKVGTRLRNLIDQVFPSSAENSLVWKGRGAPKLSVTIEVGEALKHELEVCSCDSYIFRSLLRNAAIPALTVFSGRLESLLVLPAIEPSVMYVPKSVKDLDHSLPAALRYNIEVVRCAWAAYCVVGGILKGQSWGSEARKVLRDGLSPFLSKMDAIIQRFMGPYLVEIKKQVTGSIMKCQAPESSITTHPVKSHLSLGRSIPSLGGYGAWSAPVHQPEPLRELINLLEGIRKLLYVKLACEAESRRWMVSVATQAVWKGMLVFATWAFPLPTDPQSIQSMQGSRTSQSVSATHFLNGYSLPLGKGAQHILHSGKRSPSPPAKIEFTLARELLSNLKLFSVAINDFVKDIAGLDPNSGKDCLKCGGECDLCTQGFLINSGDDGDLVREAMNEALEALSAFQLVSSALYQPDRLRESLMACLENQNSHSGSALASSEAQFPGACSTLTLALKELPPFILIHLLASRITKDSGFRLPHEVWGESWADYEAELKGFMAAEQMLPEVAHEMAKEVRRIQRRRQKALESKSQENAGGLNSPSDTSNESSTRAADDMEWMHMLILAIQTLVA